MMTTDKTTPAPMNGWSVERDVDDDELPHRLGFDGEHIAWLSTTQADAFGALLAAATPAEDLPAGVTMRPVLDAGVTVPATRGWRVPHAPGAVGPFSFAACIERIPDPAVVKVQIEGPYPTNQGGWRVEIDGDGIGTFFDLPSKALADELVARMVAGNESATVEVLART